MVTHKDAAKKDLDDIFNSLCTIKERKQGRQLSLSCGEPPEYSLDEEMLSCELVKNKAIFITQQHTGFKNVYRYTLLFKNSEWRLDKKEWFDNKWRQAYL